MAWFSVSLLFGRCVAVSEPWFFFCVLRSARLAEQSRMQSGLIRYSCMHRFILNMVGCTRMGGHIRSICVTCGMSLSSSLSSLSSFLSWLNQMQSDSLLFVVDILLFVLSVAISINIPSEQCLWYIYRLFVVCSCWHGWIMRRNLFMNHNALQSTVAHLLADSNSNRNIFTQSPRVIKVHRRVQQLFSKDTSIDD